MVSKKDKLKALEESESEPDTPRRSARGRSSSTDRAGDPEGTEEVVSGVEEGSGDYMDKIEEGMGDASLVSPAGAKRASDNPS
eukprot:3663808-Rhodomonas_salina.1